MSWTKTEYKGVYLAASGKSWNFKFRGKWSGGFPSAEEARDARDKLVEKAPDRPGGGTLAWFYQNKYKPNYLDRKKMGTRRGTDSIFRTHIGPALGNKQLESITAMDIQELVTDVTRRISISQGNTVLAKTSTILRRAFRWGFVPVNMAERVDRERVRREEKPILTGAEIFELLERLKANPRLRVIAALGALQGARKGEIYGFQWKDIDFEKRTISFVRQIQDGKEGTLKTEKSAATIPMHPVFYEIIKEWRGLDKSKIWVIPSMPRGGNHGPETRPMRDVNVRGPFDWNAIRELGLVPREMGIHSLRHSCESYLVSMGVSLEERMAFLRHSTPNMAHHYTHLYKGALENTISGLNSSHIPSTN
jgi:integrase